MSSKLKTRLGQLEAIINDDEIHTMCTVQWVGS